MHLQPGFCAPEAALAGGPVSPGCAAGAGAAAGPLLPSPEDLFPHSNLLFNFGMCYVFKCFVS